MSKKIEVGNLVKHVKPEGLRCGAGLYRVAVAISIEPLVLVSLRTDMRWANIKIDEIVFVQKGNDIQTKRCMRRLES